MNAVRTAAAVALPVSLSSLLLLLASCAGAPGGAETDRHARAVEGCTRTLERNGWRDVSVVSTQGTGGFEVQVILQEAGGIKKVCRYDSLHDTAFVQLP